jgi:hypothetical protein
VILATVLVARRTLHASLGYTVESQFAQLPPNDSQLTAWIQSQPGILARTVHVERVGSDGKTIRVFFLQSRNLAGEPPLPDLDTACNRVGSAAPVHGFRDSVVP